MTNFIIPVENEEKEVADITSKHYNHLLVQQVVRSYFANLHTGSKKQKNISEVSGGGRKPFPQKGRGRARVSSIRCTIWRGGAKVFAARGIPAKPRKINKRMYSGSIGSILRKLYEDKQLRIIDSFNLDQVNRTKDFNNRFKAEGIPGRNLIVDVQDYDLLHRVTKNLGNVTVSKPSRGDEFNPVSLLKYDCIWITSSSLPNIKRLNNSTSCR